MRTINKPQIADIEECKEKIISLLKEYNCVLETDDYSGLWLRDRDTQETEGILEEMYKLSGY
jgi:hypothetical protein